MMKEDAQAVGERILVLALDRQFARLHQNSLDFVRLITPEKLYAEPRKSPRSIPVYSCGEHILRSAAIIEQTFGGVTASLWDDPFEWTLPETLSTPELVAAYLREVEETRARAFTLFRSDRDLLKEIALPSGGLQMLCGLLFDTLQRAAHHQGRAFATLRLISDVRLSQI